MESNGKTWLLVGGAALVLLLVLRRSGSGATMTNTTPDTSARDAARYGFLSSGFAGLFDFAKAEQQSNAAVQVAGIQSSTAEALAGLQHDATLAQLRAYEDAAAAQADAQKVAARAASRGKSGFSINVPVLGSIGIHW